MPSVVLAWLGWANLFLGVFNLLPAVPLDGGRVVQAVLWWRTGDRDRADLAASRGGQIMGVLLVAAGWISVLRGAQGGLWLVFIGLFVMIVAGAERRRSTLHTALHGVRVADAMSSPVATGADWLTVQRFIDEVAVHSRHSALPLLDFEAAPAESCRSADSRRSPVRAGRRCAYARWRRRCPSARSPLRTSC